MVCHKEADKDLLLSGGKNAESPEVTEGSGKSLIWEDNNFNFYTKIDGNDVFIGRGLEVPFPFDEGDCWSLSDGKTFVYRNGIISKAESFNKDGNTLKLKECLEDLYCKFEESYLYSDPLGFVHKFNDTRDIEISGFVAAGFAFGGVPQILKTLDKIDGITRHKFYEFTFNFNAEEGLKLFKGFYYRFIKEKDVAALFLILSEILKQYGSIENFFLIGYNPSDINLKKSIESFCERALHIADFSSIYGTKNLPEHSMVRFFFTSPKDNSPCKRINLYLRWMVRNSDNLDFGIWNNGIQPYQLIMPVDTHIGRISRYIGLTKRQNPSFKMAEEITENLKKLDYSDPIKYDFAITRLGILDICTKGGNRSDCGKCGIYAICNFKG
ncbi:MAG: TIGR02757 family protein [Candidatus Acidulodesulfobacterium sp.]